MRSFRGRLTAAAAVLAVVLCAPAAHGGQVIEQGATGPVSPCSETDVDTTCLLAFGPVFAEDSAITSLELGGAYLSSVSLLRPDGDGSWSIHPLRDNYGRYQLRKGTRIIDSAFPVRAGDQLVIADPDVVVGGSTTQFVSSAGPLTAGGAVALTPVVRITAEPDADRDGYGDESQDLCPGVDGMLCEVGDLGVELHSSGQSNAFTGPYVPTLDTAHGSWIVTNNSPAPQPVLVNLLLPTNATHVPPAGVQCTPGFVASPADALVAPSMRSSLLTAALEAMPKAERQLVTMPPAPMHYDKSREQVLAAPWVHCWLGVLTPGARVAGHVSSKKWTTALPVGGFRAVAATPTGIGSFSSPGWTARVLGVAHGYQIRTKIGTISKLRSPGQLAFWADCAGSGVPGLAPCEISAVLSSKGKQLGVAPAAPLASGSFKEFPMKLSKSGLKRLAKNPKAQLDLAVTLTRRGEPGLTTQKHFKASYTPAFKRSLAKLAKAAAPKAKPKKPKGKAKK